MPDSPIGTSPEGTAHIVQVPAELYNSLSTIAKRHGIDVNELMRKFLRLGLVTVGLQEKSRGQLFVKTSQGEMREVSPFRLRPGVPSDPE